MVVTPPENEKYRSFVSRVAQDLGVFEREPEQLVWHYTNASGFLGILQSATLYATQVAALNDSNETRYATRLFNAAIKDLIVETDNDTDGVSFLKFVLECIKEDPDTPTHAISKFFVTCFSADEDDVTQWDRYGGENGYAIGFYASGLFRDPTSQLYRVIYDQDKHLKATKDIARATLTFYREGLTEERLLAPQEWAHVFFAAWDEWVYKLAPLVKDRNWRAENEYRIVHELKASEFHQVRFVQKKTMLARYLPLDTPAWVKRRSTLLPIAKIYIGPGNHPVVTKVSVKLLLEQMGYADVPVETTRSTLTRP